MKRTHGMLLALCLGIGLLTVWLFWPSVGNSFLHWDDDIYLAQSANFAPLSWRSLRWMFTATTPFYYHPLTWLSYSLNVGQTGPQPAPFHATNVLLHGLNAALVVWLTWLIASASRNGFKKFRFLAAAGVGLVFAVHPLQVEAVAWVAERKTLLCACFSLLSVVAYLLWARAEHRRGWWWLSFGMFVAALASKPMAMTLPAALLALDVMPLERTGKRSLWQLIGEKWLWFACSAADLISTFVAQRQVHAVVTLSLYGPLDRCLIAMRGIVFYLWKLAWPVWLSAFYPLEGDVSIQRREFFVPLLICLAITAVSLWFWWRGRRTIVALAWGSFVVLLLPMLGLAQVGSQAVANRFAYFAMLAPLLLAAAGFCWLANQFSRTGRIALLIFAGFIGAALSVKTRQLLPVWRDDLSFWTQVVGYYPECGIAQANLGQAELSAGQFDEALQHGQAGIELQEDYPTGYWVVEDYFFKRREFASALPYAARSVAISPDNSHHRARYGFALLKTGQFPAACVQLEAALTLEPSLWIARYNLIAALSHLGSFEEAWTNLDLLLDKDPALAKAAVKDREFSALRTNSIVGARVNARIAAALGAETGQPSK